MASLDGQTAGLVPPPRKRPERPAREKREHEKCFACGAQLPLRRPERWFDPFTGAEQNERDTTQCVECFRILACTDAGSTTEALEKLDKIREAGMVVIMKSGSFGSSSGTVSVEFGDVFKVSRVGLQSGPAHSPDYKKSMEAITVDINIGGVPLTLWPHEVAPMPWVTLMGLHKDGDYEIAYVAQEDQEGYYKLTDKAREPVRNTFGDR